MRVKMIEEHTLTILKSMNYISSNQSDLEKQNQVTRWIINKEAHAQEIQNIVKEVQLLEKYTSENMGTHYRLIIGPIDNQEANKLVSTFIAKGYKENQLILK